MSHYTRILPRDLFNEAKLLKCLGQLCLLIHDGKAPLKASQIKQKGIRRGFDIQQDESDGSIYVENLLFYTGSGATVEFRSKLNSKGVYPLFAVVYRDRNTEAHLDVFNDDGTLDAEFYDWLVANI